MLPFLHHHAGAVGAKFTGLGEQTQVWVSNSSEHCGVNDPARLLSGCGWHGSLWSERLGLEPLAAEGSLGTGLTAPRRLTSSGFSVTLQTGPVGATLLGLPISSLHLQSCTGGGR